MKSAVITPCSHFFHAGCLKKWLYVQETCPLCHCHLKNSPQLPGSGPEPAPQPHAGAEQNVARQEGPEPLAPQPQAGVQQNIVGREGPELVPQSPAGAEQNRAHWEETEPAPQRHAGAEQNAACWEGTEPPDEECPQGTGLQEGSRDNNECISSRAGSQEGTCEPREYPLSAKDEAHPAGVSPEEKQQG